MKPPHPAKSVEKVEPPAAYTRLAIQRAEQLRSCAKRCPNTLEAKRMLEDADLLEAIGAALDRDRLRTFVRSARGIVQNYALANPKYVWQGSSVARLSAQLEAARKALEEVEWISEKPARDICRAVLAKLSKGE